MKLAKAISKRLKELREAAGLSQQEVAMRADLSLSLVAKLEQGKKADPRASTLLALAGALGAKPGALLDNLFPAAPPETAPVNGAVAAPADLSLVNGTAEEGDKGKAKGKKKDKAKAKGKDKVKVKSKKD